MSDTPGTSIEILEGHGPLVEPPAFTDAEYERRLAAIRRLMAERDLDAFLSFTPENIYYLTGHDTPGYHWFQASIVTHDRKPINVLRRIETNNTLGRSWGRLAVGYDDHDDPVATTLALLDELGLRGKRIGAEAHAWFVTPVRFEALRGGVEAAGGSFVRSGLLVEQLRAVKSAEELAYTRKAAAASSRAMRAGVEASHEGLTEDEVAAVIYADLARAGSEPAGLPPFITSGPRTSMTHTTYSGRVYQRGDLLNYEIPGCFRRYVGPLYRTGSVGTPTPEQSRQAGIVREALEAVIDAIRPDAISHEVHAVSTAVFAKHGAPVPGHRTGYSIGVNYPPDWGEDQVMSIAPGNERPLEAGMAFHLVPGFFVLGEYGIVVSESVVVTAGGCEVVTEFPREVFVV